MWRLYKYQARTPLQRSAAVGRRLSCQPTWLKGTLPHSQACTASLWQAHTLAQYVLRTKNAASVAYVLMRHGAATTRRAFLARV